MLDLYRRGLGLSHVCPSWVTRCWPCWPGGRGREAMRRPLCRRSTNSPWMCVCECLCVRVQGVSLVLKVLVYLMHPCLCNAWQGVCEPSTVVSIGMCASAYGGFACSVHSRTCVCLLCVAHVTAIRVCRSGCACVRICVHVPCFSVDLGSMRVWEHVCHAPMPLRLCDARVWDDAAPCSHALVPCV